MPTLLCQKKDDKVGQAVTIHKKPTFLQNVFILKCICINLRNRKVVDKFITKLNYHMKATILRIHAKRKLLSVFNMIAQARVQKLIY